MLKSKHNNADDEFLGELSKVTKETLRTDLSLSEMLILGKYMLTFAASYSELVSDELASNPSFSLTRFYAYFRHTLLLWLETDYEFGLYMRLENEHLLSKVDL
jgi:hypothetical protein